MMKSLFCLALTLLLTVPAHAFGGWHSAVAKTLMIADPAALRGSAALKNLSTFDPRYRDQYIFETAPEKLSLLLAGLATMSPGLTSQKFEALPFAERLNILRTAARHAESQAPGILRQAYGSESPVTPSSLQGILLNNKLASEALPYLDMSDPVAAGLVRRFSAGNEFIEAYRKQRREKFEHFLKDVPRRITPGEINDMNILVRDEDGHWVVGDEWPEATGESVPEIYARRVEALEVAQRGIGKSEEAAVLRDALKHPEVGGAFDDRQAAIDFHTRLSALESSAEAQDWTMYPWLHPSAAALKKSGADRSVIEKAGDLIHILSYYEGSFSNRFVKKPNGYFETPLLPYQTSRVKAAINQGVYGIPGFEGLSVLCKTSIAQLDKVIRFWKFAIPAIWIAALAGLIPALIALGGPVSLAIGTCLFLGLAALVVLRDQYSGLFSMLIFGAVLVALGVKTLEIAGHLPVGHMGLGSALGGAFTLAGLTARVLAGKKRNLARELRDKLADRRDGVVEEMNKVNRLFVNEPMTKEFNDGYGHRQTIDLPTPPPL